MLGRTQFRSHGFARLLLASAITLAAAQAFAQPVTTVEELTVTGRPKGPPESFSYRVSYQDLDLKLEADRKELKHRIDQTVDFVCKKVDQPDSACKGEAMVKATQKMNEAIHQAQAHGVHPHGGGHWVAPPAN